MKKLFISQPMRGLTDEQILKTKEEIMDFITAEQFLEQSEKVQKVFLDWWKPTKGDLFYTLDRKYDFKINRIEAIFDNSTLVDVQENKGYYKPLFTETQLRHFIEEKTHAVIQVDYCPIGGYTIYLSNKNEMEIWKCFNNLGDDLLQAYWQVTCKIAEDIS